MPTWDVSYYPTDEREFFDMIADQDTNVTLSLTFAWLWFIWSCIPGLNVVGAILNIIGAWYQKVHVDDSRNILVFAQNKDNWSTEERYAFFQEDFKLYFSVIYEKIGQDHISMNAAGLSILLDFVLLFFWWNPVVWVLCAFLAFPTLILRFILAVQMSGAPVDWLSNGYPEWVTAF